MVLTATFTDTVPDSAISDNMYGKVLRTYLLGATEAGDSRDEPRIELAKYIYDNWACTIPLEQIGYDQYFTGYGDIVIKFKEEAATVVGGMTGHSDFVDASMFLADIPYHSRITINIIVRRDTPLTMPEEMNTIKVYIKNFIRARPAGLKDKGYQSLQLVSGSYNYPEQRDKYTFKDAVTVMMKYQKVYR
jgi:hypothetical protein